MALLTTTEMFKKAYDGGYAIGAFNVNNMEIVQAIIEAAEEEQAPVIIQASQGAISYAGLDYIVALVETAAKHATVPVALHLDHGTSFEQVVQCIGRGFTSVMIDGSKLPLEENIALTNKILDMARPLNISVEAELGKIGGTEDNVSVSEREASFTDPAEAKHFVDETGIKSLAVAIGTAHGQYKGTPKLDFERLEEIKKLVNIPIVLHGSSGVPDDDIRKAISLGVRKVNIDTNLREAFSDGVREALAANPQEIDPRKILKPAKAAMKERVKEKIRVFGSNGKAF